MISIKLRLLDDENEILIESIDMLKDLISQGRVFEDTIVYDVERDEWRKVSDIEEWKYETESSIKPQAGKLTTVQETSELPAEYDMQQENSNKRGRGLIITSTILIALGFILEIFKAFFSAELYSEIDNSHVLLYLSGALLYNMGLISLALFAICKLWVRGRRSGKVFVFSLIYVTVTFFSLRNLIVNEYKPSLRQSDNAVLNAVSDIVGGSNEEDEEDYYTSQYGELGPAVKISQEYLYTTQSDMSAMVTKMEEIGIASMITKEVMGSVDEINKAQEKLKDYEDIINEYAEIFKRRSDEFDEKVRKLTIPEDHKKGFQKGWEESREKNLERIAQYFDIQRKIKAKVSELLDFMKRKHESGILKEGEITLTRQEDVETFNNLLNDIQKLAEEEAKWYENLQKETEKEMLELQEELSKAVNDEAVNDKQEGD